MSKHQQLLFRPISHHILTRFPHLIQPIGLGKTAYRMCKGVREAIELGKTAYRLCKGMRQPIELGKTTYRLCKGVRQPIELGKTAYRLCKGVRQPVELDKKAYRLCNGVRQPIELGKTSYRLCKGVRQPVELNKTAYRLCKGVRRVRTVTVLVRQSAQHYVRYMTVSHLSAYSFSSNSKVKMRPVFYLTLSSATCHRSSHQFLSSTKAQLSITSRPNITIIFISFIPTHLHIFTL